jgi:hypothetical protein
MTVSSFVPEIWSDVLIESLQRQTRLWDALLATLPDIQVDGLIMVCGQPFWLTWEEVVEPQPVSIHYIADR